MALKPNLIVRLSILAYLLLISIPETTTEALIIYRVTQASNKLQEIDSLGSNMLSRADILQLSMVVPPLSKV